MSQELRDSLIEALSDNQKYQGKKGPPDRVTCLATIWFSDEEKYAIEEDHYRPLFIWGIFGNNPITRVMVDNGSKVNIFPWTILYVGLPVAHLKCSIMVIQGFDQNEQWPLGKISIKTRFGKIEDDLLVIVVEVAYNELLGCPWMHKMQQSHLCISSAWDRTVQGTIAAANDPFHEAEASYENADFDRTKHYQEKGKGVAEDEDIPITPKSPNV